MAATIKAKSVSVNIGKPPPGPNPRKKVLGKEWKKEWSEEYSRPYWENSETGVSQWTDPALED
jgi:hypothetical protein